MKKKILFLCLFVGGGAALSLFIYFHSSDPFHKRASFVSPDGNLQLSLYEGKDIEGTDTAQYKVVLSSKQQVIPTPFLFEALRNDGRAASVVWLKSKVLLCPTIFDGPSHMFFRLDSFKPTSPNPEDIEFLKSLSDSCSKSASEDFK